ncbi:GGDEF domain-containing protein [Halomonas sp.]|uniref:GGDEF domain-containing protein n=1 Tax=Halomonas sp. TaxID=1486246 RepID=UPI0035684C1A
MTDLLSRVSRLQAMVFAAGALLMAVHGLWLYLMGDYSRLILPATTVPLMVLAAILRMGRNEPSRLSSYLVLIGGYLLIAVELIQPSGQASLWLGLPPILTLLVLPLGPAILLNTALAPIWVVLLGELPPDPRLVIGYLTLVVMAGLVPWEVLRQKALMRVTDPGDDECSALNALSLHDRLYSESQRAGFLDQPLAVLVLHLPQLEMAGEQFGPKARQALLDAVCQEVEKRCRDNDLLGRESSEDFWLVLPDTSENGALLVAQRLEEGLQDVVLLETGQVEVRLTPCILRAGESPEHFEQRLMARTQHLADP